MAQNLPKKVNTAVYTWKWMFSKLPKKSPYIWATCERKFVTKNRPILSHWLVTSLLWDKDYTVRQRQLWIKYEISNRLWTVATMQGLLLTILLYISHKFNLIKSAIYWKNFEQKWLNVIVNEAYDMFYAIKASL